MALDLVEQTWRAEEWRCSVEGKLSPRHWVAAEELCTAPLRVGCRITGLVPCSISETIGSMGIAPSRRGNCLISTGEALSATLPSMVQLYGVSK